MKFNTLFFNLLFWLFYFLYQWLGLASLYGDYNGYFLNACMALPVALVFSVLTVHIFFRRLYQQGRRALFWLSLLISALLLLLVRRYVNYDVIYPRYFPHALSMSFFAPGKLLVELVNLYTITGLYALSFFIRWWYDERHRVQELLQHKTRAELDLLKAQVQPHFIFNTLNNIYSTALASSPETAALIARLSGVLDYSLYDASRDRVALSAELDYIRHYIGLQQNRYGSRLEVEMHVPDRVDDLQLAPLLLLPLVENSFKHGVATAAAAAWVQVRVYRQAGWLVVEIGNSREEAAAPFIVRGGLGLTNLRKRLQLVYPGQHELQVTVHANSCSVCLKIQTNEGKVFDR
ncbi:sensor histidine kinase [Pedobacter yulinensis]|uniref:Sensor histidine kinase n=1 Tax=Pedobacter yulinensis TaxID=2126353 RepID=A0A2T3HMH3_9SPHI|nr:histidine kinase [Pedobacter yulinensis]PST83640.1 sensor histidine kinase [Pedobacter yulinensis]